MRIRGSGSGFLGFGGGGKDRSDNFKKGRRPGQKVRGTLLRRVSSELAWFNIEGHELLAQIGAGVPDGAVITFIIKQLHPEIILKAVFEPSQSGANALALAKDVDTSRTLFENQFRRYAADLAASPHHERKAVFLDQTAQDAKLLSTFLDVVNCVNCINETAAAQSRGTLSYTPWIIPTGRRHITLTKRTSASLIETIVECEMNRLGMVRAEFLTKGSDISYRLKVQHKAKARDLMRYMLSRDRRGFAGELQCLEVAQLPQRNHGGILAELMFKQP